MSGWLGVSARGMPCDTVGCADGAFGGGDDCGAVLLAFWVCVMKLTADCAGSGCGACAGGLYAGVAVCTICFGARVFLAGGAAAVCSGAFAVPCSAMVRCLISLGGISLIGVSEVPDMACRVAAIVPVARGPDRAKPARFRRAPAAPFQARTAQGRKVRPEPPSAKTLDNSACQRSRNPKCCSTGVPPRRRPTRVARTIMGAARAHNRPADRISSNIGRCNTSLAASKWPVSSILPAPSRSLTMPPASRTSRMPAAISQGDRSRSQ